MTAEPDLLPLPLTLRHPSDKDLADHVQTYARACVAQATAAKDAEVEALRAEVEVLRASSFANATVHIGIERDQLKARAERLAEALRERRDWFEAQAKSISKGNGSSWDLMQVREQRDLCDAALDQEAGRG